jgi:hypothetical protein
MGCTMVLDKTERCMCECVRAFVREFASAHTRWEEVTGFIATISCTEIERPRSLPQLWLCSPRGTTSMNQNKRTDKSEDAKRKVLINVNGSETLRSMNGVKFLIS